MKKNLFETEFEKFNRRSTVERALDDFLEKCLAEEAHIESHHLATKELLERYMAVVRSRNNVRRNWHPEQARVCDIQTLMLVSKEEFQNSLDRRLRKALVVTSNGSKVITEESIQELVNETVNDAYKSNRKNPKPSPLEEIVRTIRKSNPEATSTDVIATIKATPKEFGIVDIDEHYVMIEVPQGAGKQAKRIPRSLLTIKNILTKLKPP
jgi:hypothetical protein